jgi:hypothetical protein
MLRKIPMYIGILVLQKIYAWRQLKEISKPLIFYIICIQHEHVI